MSDPNSISARLDQLIVFRAAGIPCEDLCVCGYRILGRIGGGGMGTVFLAEDPQLGRQVALKVLRQADPNNELASALLAREARNLARLDHENIVTVHQLCTTQGGESFIVMQYVEGRTLRDWQLGQPTKAILAAYRHAGEALAHAHREGIVHLDFKPSNVFVVERDAERPRFLVGDFGIAEALREGRTSGSSAGTPAYMSPEQRRGDALDAASDQYTFCLVLWEALTGAQPRFIEGVPVRASGLSVPLHRALARGLAAQPHERWPSMEALLEVLEREPAARAARVAHFGAVFLLGALCASFFRPSPCASEGQELRQVWGEDARAELLASGSRLGVDEVGILVEGLDRALAWGMSEGHELCELEGADSQAAGLPQRAQCFERWQAQLDHRVAQLGTAEGLSAAALEPELFLAPLFEASGSCELLAPELGEMLEVSERARLQLDWDTARAQAQRALDAAGSSVACVEGSGASLERAAALLHLGRANADARPEQALDDLDRASEDARVCGATGLLSEIDMARATLWAAHLDQPYNADQALASAKATLDERREHADSLRRLEWRHAAGFVAMQAGRLDEALAIYTPLAAELEARALPLRAAKAHNNVGKIHALRDQPGLALAAYEHALDLDVEAAGLDSGRAERALLNIGGAYLELGEAEIGADYLELALDSERPYVRLKALALLVGLDGPLLTHRIERARQELRNQPQAPTRVRAELATKAADALDAHKRHAEAIELYEQGLQLWRESGKRDEMLACAYNQVVALVGDGRCREARERAIHGRESAREQGAEALAEHFEQFLDYLDKHSGCS